MYVLIPTQREVHCASLLAHVKCIACPQACVFNLLQGGELFDFLLSESSVPEELCKHLIRQILLSLEYLHSMNIVHRYLSTHTDTHTCYGGTRTHTHTRYEETRALTYTHFDTHTL